MSRRVLTLALAAGALAAMTLGTAACGSSSKSSSSSQAQGLPATQGTNGAQGSPAPDGASADTSLPMDAYMLTSDKDSKVVRQAMQISIHGCMKRYGFDYQLPADDSPSRTIHRLPFGIEDPKQAQVWGYHYPQTAPSPPVAAPVDPNTPDPDKNSPQQLVLTGGVAKSGGLSVPSGGCKGEAEQKVMGDYLTADLSVLNGPRGSSQTPDATPGGPAGRDPRVQAALTAWADCMKGKGYQYTAPDQATRAFLKGPGSQSAQPSADEISTAVADAACKQQTRLNPIWITAETDLEKTFIEQHATELAQVKKLQEDEVKRAAAIVGSGS